MNSEGKCAASGGSSGGDDDTATCTGAFYADGSTCKKCPDNCSTCESSDKCTSCF